MAKRIPAFEKITPRVLWSKASFDPKTGVARFFNFSRAERPSKTNVRVPGLTLGSVDSFGITAIGVFGHPATYDIRTKRYSDAVCALKLINKPQLTIPLSCIAAYPDLTVAHIKEFETQPDFLKKGPASAKGALNLSVVLVVCHLDTIDFTMTASDAIPEGEYTVALFGNSIAMPKTEYSVWEKKALKEHP